MVVYYDPSDCMFILYPTLNNIAIHDHKYRVEVESGAEVIVNRISAPDLDDLQMRLMLTGYRPESWFKSLQLKW